MNIIMQINSQFVVLGAFMEKCYHYYYLYWNFDGEAISQWNMAFGMQFIQIKIFIDICIHPATHYIYLLYGKWKML